MNRVFFHTANAIAMLVFYIFYIAMIWCCAEMADYIGFVDASAWALWAEAAFIAAAALGLALFLVAAYNTFIRGPQCRRGRKHFTPAPISAANPSI